MGIRHAPPMPLDLLKVRGRSRLWPHTMYRHGRACSTSEYHRIHGPRIAESAVNDQQGALWLAVIKERRSSDPRTDARSTVRDFSPPGVYRTPGCRGAVNGRRANRWACNYACLSYRAFYDQCLLHN